MNDNGKIPFQFFTSSLLVEITGKMAGDLAEFLEILKTVDDPSIFYHVHHAFREYSFAPGQYANDFARWIAEDLEEGALAEKIASVNVMSFTDIAALRQALVVIIDDHLARAKQSRHAPPGREFHFLSNVGVIVPTKHEARTLKEFVEALRQVGMRSLYYHFFDARLRLGHKTNDFSNWIRTSFHDEKLAAEIEALDPYFMTLDQLKAKIIALCSRDEKKGFDLYELFNRVKKVWIK